MACTVPGCTSRASNLIEKDRNISFHRFPTDIDLKETWIKHVRKGDDWRPSQHTRICSIHFEDSCFREGYGRKVLHSYAVPTIFRNLPSSCKPKLPRKRNLPTKYLDAQALTSTAAEDQVHESVAKISSMTQTENEEGVSELVVVNKLIKKYKTLAEKRGRQLKTLQRKCSRLTKKTADLKTVIQVLYEKMESENIAI